MFWRAGGHETDSSRSRWTGSGHLKVSCIRDLADECVSCLRHNMGGTVWPKADQRDYSKLRVRPCLAEHTATSAETHTKSGGEGR